MKAPTPRRTKRKPADEPQTDRRTEIRFYRANEKPYRAFSNLFPRRVQFEGREFATAEHAYQAGKARKPEVRKWILSAPTPSPWAVHLGYRPGLVPHQV